MIKILGAVLIVTSACAVGFRMAGSVRYEERCLRQLSAALEMMRCACRAIELLERMEISCSRLMLSDVGCGALAAKAALEAAALNAFVNTRTLPTDPTAREYADQADAMLTEYRERAQRVSDGVLAALRGRKHG